MSGIGIEFKIKSIEMYLRYKWIDKPWRKWRDDLLIQRLIRNQDSYNKYINAVVDTIEKS